MFRLYDTIPNETGKEITNKLHNLALMCIFAGENMNNSQNPSSLRSKKEITDALLKLMRDHPYSEISVKQIVMETSLARKTFYLNFTLGSKI